MHDFNCSNAGDMNYGIMAEKTKYLKEHPKGVSEMRRAIEDMVKEYETIAEARGLQRGMAAGRLEGMAAGRCDMLFEAVSEGRIRYPEPLRKQN